MEEQIDYEKIRAEVKKIKYNLEETKMTIANKLILLNILRYDLGLIEDKEKQKKVEYNYFQKKLNTSESIKIGIAIATAINNEIRKSTDIRLQQDLYNVMRETYYYLARYLFEYFLIALEFGIPPEKQFIAPRSCVLNKVAIEMSKFYYRTDRPILSLNMPQGTRKN